MTNPLPHNSKQRAEDRMTKDANTLFKLAILESNQVKGRFAGEESSKVVGAGAVYPPSAGPWSATAPRPGDEPLIDGRGSAPIVGELHERNPVSPTIWSDNADVPGLETEKLQRELGQIQELFTSQHAPVWNAKMQALDNRRIVIEHELAMRQQSANEQNRKSIAKLHYEMKLTMDTDKLDQLQAQINQLERRI